VCKKNSKTKVHFPYFLCTKWFCLPNCS